MLVRIVCEACGKTLRLDTDVAREQLRHTRHGVDWSFGGHVTDPRAFPIRLASIARWRYVGGDIGRTVISMMCPTCVRWEPSDLPSVSDGEAMA